MVSRDSIQKYADAIAREFQPEKIILFGSHAYGRPTEDSDVDLMVVMAKGRWSRRKSTDIRVRLGYSGFPMDLLVWTPERLREWSQAGDGFARDILERGEVLYEQRCA
jgi:predicted nucleotidyltransferase